MNPGFFRAATYPFRGAATLLRRPALLKYAAGAWAVTLAVFAVLAVAFFAFLPDFVDRLTPERTPAWLGPVLGCVLTLVAAVLALFLFTIVGNLVAGPFLEAMTERLLAGLGETLPPPRGFWRSAAHSLLDQARKLLLFGSLQLAILALLVTPAAPLHPFLSGLLMAVFLALEYLDYPLGARGVPVAHRLGWVMTHLRPSLGFGASAFLLLLVPAAGLLFLPALACGAALLAHDIDGRSSKL